jgi:hypothetical protein
MHRDFNADLKVYSLLKTLSPLYGFVTYKTEFGLVNRFIDHMQVVTTNNCYTIAAFHTTNHSELSLLSLFPLIFTS